MPLARRSLHLDPTVQTAWCVEIDACLALGDVAGARDAAQRGNAELLRRGVTIAPMTNEAFARAGDDRLA